MFNQHNTLKCPKCGAVKNKSFSFCPNCGMDFNENKIKYNKDISSWKREFYKQNRGWFIYIGLIIIVVLSVTAYQIIPFILEDLSPKNPVILYISATIVYLINLYTFQYKKILQNFIYLILMIISIAYSIFFFVMIYNSNYGFLGLVGPLITIIMIFSPFIIGRKNITIR